MRYDSTCTCMRYDSTCTRYDGTCICMRYDSTCTCMRYDGTCTCMRYVHVHSQTGFLYLYLMRQGIVRIKFIEELVNRKVKGWNNFLWVSYKLRVEIFIKRSQMIRINVKKRFFKYVDLRETKIRIDTYYTHMLTCTCTHLHLCTCTYIYISRISITQNILYKYMSTSCTNVLHVHNYIHVPLQAFVNTEVLSHPLVSHLLQKEYHVHTVVRRVQRFF